MWAKYYSSKNLIDRKTDMAREKKIPNAGERLKSAADTYIERNKVYGDSYKQHGKILKALFPEGLKLESVEDHNRMGVLNIILSKLNRYCNNFAKGGHQDSIHDLGVYSFMLEELDEESEEHYKVMRDADDFVEGLLGIIPAAPVIPPQSEAFHKEAMGVLDPGYDVKTGVKQPTNHIRG